MHLIPSPDLYGAWRAINEFFIKGESEDAMVMPGRDFSIARYLVRLSVKGLWLPEEYPPFFTDRRLSLLEGRYIDPPIWQEGINRFKNGKSITGSYPNSFVMQFHRNPERVKKVPKGGGCLIAATFTWYNKQWHLHMLSRASEITARLISDMYFVRKKLFEVVEEGEIKHFDPHNTPMVWDLVLPSQMKYMVPMFLLFTEGEKAVRDFMLAPSETPWQEVIKSHFWDEFIFPENINWMQRKRRSEDFLEQTTINWREVKEENNL